VSVVPYHDAPARGDALKLLRSLPEGCAACVFFDPQHRGVLNKLKYGNEGSRQRERCALPPMSDTYIQHCDCEIARVLKPSGYSFIWVDVYRLLTGTHLHIKESLICVSLIAWDSGRLGMGYRVRERGDYLIALQKPPLRAKATWKDHGVPSRWAEKVDQRIHPHIKPINLIRRLVAAVTLPGELVVDPAAGSFIVMRAAHKLGRRFVGCDLRVPNQTGRKTMNTTETALEKLEKFLEAEFETYWVEAGPDASVEGFEKRVTPLMLADPELVGAAMRRVVDDPELLSAALTEIVDRADLEAKVVANSDETLMQFLQSRS
jgi:site-specific DNA-methyltransferase (adenine-specific)